MRRGIVLCALAIAALRASAPGAETWPCLGGGPARTCERIGRTPSLTQPLWVLAQTPAGEEIEYFESAGVAVGFVTAPEFVAARASVDSVSRMATSIPSNGAGDQKSQPVAPCVFVGARIGDEPVALAVDGRNGSIVWTTPIPESIYDTQMTPCIDASTQTVLFASGWNLTALRASDGAEVWQTWLDGPALDASPLVTSDLGRANRAFITDYGGFGGPSSLYCINVSPYHPTLNPFAPGAIVWAAPIGSATGATPAYKDGIVYVASTGLDGAGNGEIRAFDATATSQPLPLWTFTNPITEGFFGGLCVQETEGGTYLYASTYAFYGGMDSANLVKVDAASGQLEWSVACNRTGSIPVVLPDGRVALSTGIQGFGSLPSLQMFVDEGDFAYLQWDTALDTWVDANHNGVIEAGEFVVVGGWTTQPLLVLQFGQPRLLIGAIPTGINSFGEYTRLYEIDLMKTPSQPGFFVQQTTSAGSTPAMTRSTVYSVGPSGLAAFGGN